MNQAYRVIFNHATGVWQCVSELARSKGKSKSFKALALVGAVMASSQAMAVDYTTSTTLTNPYNLDGSDSILQATINGTEINIGNNAQGTITANNGTLNASQYLRFGFNNGSQGSGAFNNSDINTKDETVIGFSGNGDVSLTNSSALTTKQLSLGMDVGATAKLSATDSAIIVGNQSANDGNLVVGVSGIGEITITGKAINPTSYPYNQYSSDLAVYGDAIIGALPNSQGKITIDGYTGFNVAKNLIIGAGGQGKVTFNKNSPDSSGHTRADKIYIGGYEDSVNNAQTTNGKGTLSLIDSDLTANEIIVGNTGSGTLNLRIDDVDNFISTLTINQISRNPNSQLSEIYLNGGEISIELDQPNLFANFTKDNKIEIGEKGIGFVTGDHRVNNPTSANATINPNAVITGNAGSFDINNPDIPGGFFKSGVGTLTISENTKQFAGDIAITRGTLKIDGNYTMNGENLIIGLIDWNSDDTFDNKDEYGKLIVTGKADVSNGNLAVYVDELIKNGITADTVVKDVVTAGTLTGQFKQVTDNSLLVDFSADYSDANKVHLRMVKEGSATAPTTPTTPTTPIEPELVTHKGDIDTGAAATAEPLPSIDPSTLVPTQPVETPLVTHKGDIDTGAAATADALPSIDPSTLTPSATTRFVKSVTDNSNLASLGIAAYLDQQVDTALAGSASALATAIIANATTTNGFVADGAKFSQAASELQPLLVGSTNRLIHQANAGAIDAVFEQDTIRDRTLWAKVIGKNSTLDATDDGLFGYANDELGVVTGIDHWYGNTKAGLALSYVQSDADTNGASTVHTVTADTAQVIAYADHYPTDSVRLYGQAAIGQSQIQGKRYINALTSAVAESDYQADTMNAGFGVEYRIGTPSANITPFMRLNYALVQADAYQETGAGVYNLSVDAQDYQSLQATVGAKFKQTIGSKLGLTGTLAVAGENGDRRTDIRAGFVDTAGQFTTHGHEVGRAIGIVGIGATYQLSPMAQISAGYQGQWQSGYDSQSANIGFNMRF